MDQDGQVGVGRATIDVAPRVPVNVNLTADPPRPTAGDIVVFTATVSGSTVPVARYEWELRRRGRRHHCRQRRRPCLYDGRRATTAGARTARVTVFSVGDDRGTSQTTVIVAPAQLAMTLAVDPIVADAGQPVTFTATVSPATAVIVRYEWDFGDAAGSTASTTSPSTTLAYGDADRGVDPDRRRHRRRVRRDLRIDPGARLDQPIERWRRHLAAGQAQEPAVPRCVRPQLANLQQ